MIQTDAVGAPAAQSKQLTSDATVTHERYALTRLGELMATPKID